MVKRRIINIDKQLCNGCGLCVNACHEGAIVMVDGKAQLLRDDYCDGLGDCLPVCPTGAITFIEKETLPYNEEEVLRNMAEKKQTLSGCPGTAFKQFSAKKQPDAQQDSAPNKHQGCPGAAARRFNVKSTAAATAESEPAQQQPSMLGQWPVQLKLIPVNSPCFRGAKLLIAADCSAFACGSFHNRFMKGRVTLIGCPKLDEGDYSIKLTEIFKNNDIKSVTIVKMEVPCCSGLGNAAIKALQACGKMIPWELITLSLEGEVLED